MDSAVALINPKYPRNVGNILRACSNFGCDALAWTPERIAHPDDWPLGSRLPREERMKLYQDVSVETVDRTCIVDRFEDLIPIAVEVRDNAELLPNFIHPEKALYVFGPEDGSLNKGILTACYRFIVIPSTSCLNLAAAVNVVLYDRLAKTHEGFIPHSEKAYAGIEG